ncbi:MAG: divalent-cation tolerance protein CutA [Hydrogenophaga sp.]|nr:divalent-cation tolerance protein CutA [Hydrogenophaga sp.]
MTDSAPMLMVVTTVATREEARGMAHELVRRHLAACVQIHAIESVYEWNGTVAQDAEWRLMLKTRADVYPAVEAAILELHRYELPAVFAVPVSQASTAYGDWVMQSAQLPRANVP